MPRIIKKVLFPPVAPKLVRVAAYARVFSGKDAMLHSLAAQIDYYANYSRAHSGWQYMGVYIDEAKTGIKEERSGFQDLLNDCREGKIDRIITKSISRFARNTVTLLSTVRELKALGVSVYFEAQNIDTSSSDGELMLTILASSAQEESLSTSENQKWRVRQNFQEGKPWRGFMLGYRYDGEKYVVVPEEAEVVKSIFDDYLSGKGIPTIIKRLESQNILTQQGHSWHNAAISRILRNYAYTGNLLLQTKYRENHLSKRTLLNHGELPQYHASNTHEPIISSETFDAVQAEIARRAEKYARNKKGSSYPFTGLITCAHCGRHYRRKITPTGPIWICSTYNSKGKADCPSKAIPETTLTKLAAEVATMDKITAITAKENNVLVFTLADGSQIVKEWQDRSRADSWTPEMRKASAAITRERNLSNAHS